MRIDGQHELSDAQAITASAASTNNYNIGSAGDVGPGSVLKLGFVIDQSFNNLTSLSIALQTDDNSSFSSATTLWTVTFALASLTAGAKVNLPPIPSGCEQYIQLYYTVTGTAPSTGKVSAFITPALQNSVALSDD